MLTVSNPENRQVPETCRRQYPYSKGKVRSSLNIRSHRIIHPAEPKLRKIPTEIYAKQKALQKQIGNRSLDSEIETAYAENRNGRTETPIRPTIDTEPETRPRIIESKCLPETRNTEAPQRMPQIQTTAKMAVPFREQKSL